MPASILATQQPGQLTPTPTPGFVLLIDSDGAYLTDPDGSYLQEAA